VVPAKVLKVVKELSGTIPMEEKEKWYETDT